jgi:hypothetical protein
MHTFIFLLGLLFYPEEGGSNCLRNVGTSLHGYTLLHNSTAILIFTWFQKDKKIGLSGIK